MSFKKIIFTFLIFIFLTNVTSAQSLAELEPRLAILANTMVKDTFPPNRVKAAEEFNPLFINALQQKDAFKFRFDSIANVAITIPSDSSFRIFTWQLIRDSANYEYFGAIQMKGKKPKVIVLKDQFHEIEEKEFEDCTPEHWCGGLIYKIKEFQGKGGKQYLIFSYNVNTLFERTKFVDILKLRDGKFTFGAPLFVQKGKETRKRITITYSADVKARMTYDEALQMIVFDHLIAQKHELIGNTLVPDGDYEGYRLEKGLWQYVADAVPTTAQATPMLPAPILDKRKNRNIFGKKKKD
jgi:hypothetical protein